MANGTEVLSSLPIALYGRLLQQAGFFRVHRSFLINLDHVTGILRSGDVILTGGAEVPISKGNIKALVHALNTLNDPIS